VGEEDTGVELTTKYRLKQVKAMRFVAVATILSPVGVAKLHAITGTSQGSSISMRIQAPAFTIPLTPRHNKYV